MRNRLTIEKQELTHTIIKPQSKITGLNHFHQTHDAYKKPSCNIVKSKKTLNTVNAKNRISGSLSLKKEMALLKLNGIDLNLLVEENRTGTSISIPILLRTNYELPIY